MYKENSPQVRQGTNPSEERTAFSAPAISLPKGGGAIRGIGEKFAANPVTGTGSMTVPIATSPGRSGFGPQLSLSYDSGSGNGPFGFGWSLSIPSITRKTDKGLPQYHAAIESDVFILSGIEDLVPVLQPDGRRFEDTTTASGYTIHKYRPRIEGLFARIERWTKDDDPSDIHWRSISKDNILSLYGKDINSRIANPEDPKRIFSWLICETRDDKGNAVYYEYKAENGEGVDLTQAHERNRGSREDRRRTANRYLKRIYYGNRTPLLDNSGKRLRWLSAAQIKNAGWMFEVVFDYADHDPDIPRPKDDEEIDAAGKLKWPWAYRQDTFSSYRSGFEVRTSRLCQRVLMFHHFESEPGIGKDCLVRSTDFEYSFEIDPHNTQNPIYSFLSSITQSGYKRQGNGYLKRSLPPIEFEYSQPIVQDTIEAVDAESLENLPYGLDGTAYQWTDLHGEGITGILSEQAGAWFYKRNHSPNNLVPGSASDHIGAKFAPTELVDVKPNLPLAGGAQFMDLAGDGLPDLVVLDGPLPGLFEHDNAEGWLPFQPFSSPLRRNLRDPNLKFVDLDGDGHTDVLIAEDDFFTWHPSLAEQGFGPACRVAQGLNEEKGPRLVFADGTQSIYLADLSGDGLTDLARIQNGEVCYWPNLGYGRFGAKVTMDNAPWFDHPDHFEQRRIRLADIDGSGTTDIIYLHREGVRLYFNQSGNRWSDPRVLNVFPRLDDLVSIMPTDLLGNSTACLVWSSPLPGDSPLVMRYQKLMGDQKPHLLIKIINNLGAETRVHYSPSTKFYLQDKQDGHSWITRLPFPVHVVERVETYDHISYNRFVTRYSYHHGYFDGEEREFRGFGLVEQWDTEEFAALTGDGTLGRISNLGRSSHIPPVHTRTWFHTGIYQDREHVSRQFEGEYYREPNLSDLEFRRLLLPDTVLPAYLTPDEEREACRALKGMMLRQEVYADDAPPGSSEAMIQTATTPYTVVEQNFTIRALQPRDADHPAVFFTHPREVISYHYERNPVDPRIQHTLTLEVDDFGNVMNEVAIGYGRRHPDATLPLQTDRDKQTQMLITYTENRVTNAIDHLALFPHDYRIPLVCETRTYELTGYQPGNGALRFSFAEWADNNFALFGSATEIPYEQTANNITKQKRLIEHIRTLYRNDDLTSLLPLNQLMPLALPGESYKLAFTPGLLGKVFLRPRVGQPPEVLLPNVASILGGQGADRGGYIDLDNNNHWWVPTGRVFVSPNSADTPAQELAYARSHFFLPHRYRDPFYTNLVSTELIVTYDAYDLLSKETRDALGNRVTVGERLPNGTIDPSKPGNDYRVLQPQRVMDPNRNRTEVAYDALGMVVGTVVMGKPEENLGDSLNGFEADLTESSILNHLANPLVDPHTILQRATTRLVYDFFAYYRTRNTPNPQPAVVYVLARETHAANLGLGQLTKIQHSFSFSDGFGREIQKKIQAEAGPVPLRDASGKIIVGVDGQPQMMAGDAPVRWVGSGWTVFNNKGKPVRQYEPFFTDTHRFEFDERIGVSLVLFYDPVERAIARLHPDHTWEKVVFGPWRQETWDINDTVTTDPRTDGDVKGFFINPDGSSRIPTSEFLPTWHELRTDPSHATDFAARYPNAVDRINQASAATKAAAHANTPTTAHFDALGRQFLVIAHNKVNCRDHDLDGTENRFHTRVELDIEGNQRTIRDAITSAFDSQGNEVEDLLGRIVMHYDYDMLGARIHQASMEAGERWMLNDVSGKPLCAWDSLGHQIRTEYDALRRLTNSILREGVGADLLVERTIYGESQPNPETNNLRGKVFQVFDQAGVVTSDEYDFKGNLQHSQLRLAELVDPQGTRIPAYRTTLNWNSAVQLDVEVFTSRTRYDALNRPIQLIAPHSDQANTNINVIQPVYNEANLLEQVHAWLSQATEPAGLLNFSTANLHAITDIDYDAKGHRKVIEYGNGAITTYTYDPLTLRLVNLTTRRNPIAFPNDCPQPPPAGWPGCQVQSLHYTYDPVGNITSIRDEAQQTIYFRNNRVEPSAEYTYDALYRLIEASGREHLGQIGGIPIPHSHNDAPRVGILSADGFGNFSPNDGNAMGTYLERYVYDAVGNFLAMQHRGSDPAHPGWTRRYTYAETSLIEAGVGGIPRKTSNRLSATEVGSNNPLVERYVYDAHGNMIRMPHLGGNHPSSNMYWDYRDQLVQTDLGGGGTAYFVYDATGQRVRKVWEKSATLIEERIYLGGIEFFRRRNGAGALWLERETLHIMDDRQRIALVETRTFDLAGNDPAPAQLIRYHLGNHLSSATLELDDQGQIISYEEYTPYGSTSYLAVRSQTETPKRYRYTEKERDEETGLCYYELRYYASWLARWVACDPEGLTDGPNLFAFVRSNPVRFFDAKGSFTLESFEKTYTAGSLKPPKPKITDPGKPEEGKTETPDPVFLQLKKAYSIASSRPGTNDLGEKDKYLYTQYAGIVDVQHFFGAAKDVYAGHVLLKQELPDAKKKTLESLEKNERAFFSRAYSQDDLPSNALGVLFGEHLIQLKKKNPNTDIDVALEAVKFLKRLGPLDEANFNKLDEEYTLGSLGIRGKAKAMTAEPIPIAEEIILSTGGDESPFKSLRGKGGQALLLEKGIELDPNITVKSVKDESVQNPIGLRWRGGKDPLIEP